MGDDTGIELEVTMRPIERKVLDKIGDNGMTIDQIEEIVDSAQPSEMKKSYPDDCLFQTPRQFAKSIAESLVRQRVVIREGNTLKKPKKMEKKDSE
jgi:hypothetical protein